jgi:hypothetical protein
MYKALLLLVAVMAFFSFASSRPLMFFADQTDAPLGISEGWAGISFAFTTTKKGQNYHRVRFFGAAHINETITDAWINYKNGTIIEHLAVSTNKSNLYYLADYRMNDTIWDLLTHEELWITTASEDHENGSISGYFRCRPYQGVSVLTADQIVGSNSSTSAVGLGWGSLDISTIFSLPQDILAQDRSIEANTFFNGRVIHDENNATAVTFNGPANTSENADALATATLYNSIYQDGKFTNITVDADFPSLAFDLTYFEVTSATNQDIRGQIYALLTPTRRAVPYSVDTVNGVTGVPTAGFRTLRYANQEGTERNSNSYVSLASTANPTNFTYLAVYYFKAATNKKNFDLVRAITIEMNAQISGTGTWLFEVFDALNGEFLPLGTLSSADTWTPAYIHSFSFDTPNYANNRGQLILRVSVNSESQTTLFLDLFGVRSWTPSSLSNQALRLDALIFNSQPGEFTNGTTINE